MSSKNNYKTLSNNELIKIIQQLNDEEAKEVFVIKNQGLIYSCIQKFYSKGNKEELFQIGCVGLMKALNNFDLSKEFQFSTYAIPIILGEIKRYFRDDQALRISRSIKENYKVMLKAKDEYIQTYQKEPSYEELARMSNISIEEVYIAFDAHQYVSSIDEEINDDGKIITLSDQISKEDKDLLMSTSLNYEISLLSNKEKLILYLRYTLGYKQNEIAIRLNSTQVQISRIEKQILLKLKDKMMN